MQYNSIPFIFYFLPVFLAVYYIFPEKSRNGVLLIGSYLFLVLGAQGEIWRLGLLAGLTVVTFLAGKVLEEGKCRWVMAACFVLMAGLLLFFKVYQHGMLISPGMSFYLFQMSAYLFDVRHKKLPAEQSLCRYATQIAMFPKFLSGPLMEPAELQRQTWGRGYLPRDFYQGLQELILGLGLKVLLADRLGGLWNQAAVVGYDSISTPFAWMALAAYALRLYFDFLGYSVMAMGVGRMLGFELPKNFDNPYASRSVSEFYRRWHMTLGIWFRTYVYFPLGGSRGSLLKTVINLGIVWLFTGIWHGIGWNYLIWAGFLFLLIVNEKLWLGKWLKRSRVLCHIYTPAVILLSWVPFAIEEPVQMIIFAGRLFGTTGVSINPLDFLSWSGRYGVLLLCGALLATPLPEKLWLRIRDKSVTAVILFALFWVIIYFLATSSQDPFVYFQY